MKKNFKLLGSTLIVLFAVISCDKSNLLPEVDLEHQVVVDYPSTNDSIKFGYGNISPLTGSLTNLVSENFELGGQNYYCYQLKLEKLYPGHAVYPNGGGGSFDLSYSINFKFFTEQESGPVDCEYTIEFQDNIIIYYMAMDRSYAVDKKAIAFLFGDKSFDPDLNAIEYKDYLKSQIRIKSGTVQIKKSGEIYQVSFEGETETGEKVSSNFNDKISLEADNQIESAEEDFSLTEISGNYIEKNGKYYKLDDGYYYIFSPSTYQGNTIQTVQVIASRDYYWYEYEKDYFFYEQDPERITQHWKSNAMVLQFQFSNLNQLQSKMYNVAPNDGINSIGYGLGVFKNIPFKGFPNDSLLIGYYHIATDTPFTFTYDEDPNYMKSQVALKSGQLKLIKNSSEYVFTGDFVDEKGDEVRVKFKAIPYPWQFEL